MQNTTELREQLVNVFEGVKSGTINVSKGKTLVAASNAILKSAQLELEQNKLTGTKKIVKLLKTQ